MVSRLLGQLEETLLIHTKYMFATRSYTFPNLHNHNNSPPPTKRAKMKIDILSSEGSDNSALDNTDHDFGLYQVKNDDEIVDQQRKLLEQFR